MTESFKVESGLKVLCPCGGSVQVSRVAEGSDMPVGTPVVFHTMPICAQYEGLEPGDFLKWVRTGEFPEGS
jgi:hypothetical protein